MATGAGLGNLIPVAMAVAGIVTMVRARAGRRNGKAAVDEDFERRQAATLEMERRMASYLAGRDMGRHHAAPEERNEQENGR